MEGVLLKGDENARHRHGNGYKSWKKKYRKMRIVFDHKMQHGEDLHKHEDKASATVKRLAIENDRLLDLLLEINNSPQIPPERRIDLAPNPASNALSRTLPSDRSPLKGKSTMKRLEQLLKDVPFTPYSSSKETQSPYSTDLTPIGGEAYSIAFLSADDVDNYIFDLDTALDPDACIPSLAPKAHPDIHPTPHPYLKNPTSVTNWLRKHAPKIFLQDGEHSSAGVIGGGNEGEDAEHGSAHQHGGRKARGTKSERGGKASGGSKRASAVARLPVERTLDWVAGMDEDPDFGATPVSRGKRKRDDDPGYRPGGSSSRPSKKKRKSDADGTPTARKVRQEATFTVVATPPASTSAHSMPNAVADSSSRTVKISNLNACVDSFT